MVRERSDSHLLEGLAKLGQAVPSVYVELSQWARHYHTLIWTNAALGITISLAAIAYFQDSDRATFSAVGGASLAILYAFHRLAESNRSQWLNCMHTINAIECFWSLRDPVQNPHGPLISADPARYGPTRSSRQAVYVVCACIVALAVALKWLLPLGKPAA